MTLMTRTDGALSQSVSSLSIPQQPARMERKRD